MMMYAQDEYGYITRRNDRGNRRPPGTASCAGGRDARVLFDAASQTNQGKHHVQVCTNVACMLRGGAELLAHAKKRLEIGNKETTPDGVFSLEEVECIGACTGAPAMQVNYDFYEDLTHSNSTVSSRNSTRAGILLLSPSSPARSMSANKHEIPLISKRWGIKDSQKIDVYPRKRRLSGAREGT